MEKCHDIFERINVACSTRPMHRLFHLHEPVVHRVVRLQGRIFPRISHGGLRTGVSPVVGVKCNPNVARAVDQFVLVTHLASPPSFYLKNAYKIQPMPTKMKNLKSKNRTQRRL